MNILYTGLVLLGEFGDLWHGNLCIYAIVHVEKQEPLELGCTQAHGY